MSYLDAASEETSYSCGHCTKATVTFCLQQNAAFFGDLNLFKSFTYLLTYLLKMFSSRLLLFSQFLLTRRYAIAVFATATCPSVCPSVRHTPVLCENGAF